MPPVSTPAIVLSTLRYSETSKIVRLATRDHGVQSVIAKGALRPKSRFGASLQLLSEGEAQFLLKEHRELHLLTSFDLRRLHVGLATGLERYAVACALSEVMLRFAPPDPHPESFDLLRHARAELEVAPLSSVEALGYRLLWQMVSVLGFRALARCLRHRWHSAVRKWTAAVQYPGRRSAVSGLCRPTRCHSASGASPG